MMKEREERGVERGSGKSNNTYTHQNKFLTTYCNTIFSLHLFLLLLLFLFLLFLLLLLPFLSFLVLGEAFFAVLYLKDNTLSFFSTSSPPSPSCSPPPPPPFPFLFPSPSLLVSFFFFCLVPLSFPSFLFHLLFLRFLFLLRPSLPVWLTSLALTVLTIYYFIHWEMPRL